MTKVIEKYYCDLCGKESSTKLKGNIHIENGRCFSAHRYIYLDEVCSECCEEIIKFIRKKQRGEE